jgi:hypothetical protein
VSVALQLRRQPLAGFSEIGLDEANELLVDWGHYLGDCDRPFRSEAYAYDVGGRIVSVAVSSSAVNHVTDLDGRTWHRNEIVELSRLCTRPGEEWATRVMLRQWRELAAPAWCCPRPRRGLRPLVAIAYSKNDRHDGRIYRFDGWEKIRETAGSGGGGAWSRKQYASDAAHGRKTLWLWRLA